MMRVSSIVLASFAFVPFVACGGGSPQPSTPTSTTSAATPTTTESAAPTPSTDTTTSADASTAPPTTNAPGPLPMVAFQIVATDASKKVLYDVKSDGTIADDGGNKIGSIDGHSIKLSDASDPVWTVDDDGAVHGAMFPKAKAKFDDKDVLVLEDGKFKATVTVDDAGNVTGNGPKGKDAMPWKVVGDVAKAKRAAALLSLTIARPKKK